jgi:type I restriction-modification system DNA methylase subunit
MLAERSVTAHITTSDFFDVEPDQHFDAVVGNPPFIRYQEFTGDARRRSREAALSQGVALSALASSWAAFVVHSSAFLNPSGRLGFVVPAELLSVNYAGPVRQFLLDRFASVRLILFGNSVFPGVQEEIVLLLAEGTGPTDHFELYEAWDASHLTTRPDTPAHGSRCALIAGIQRPQRLEPPPLLQR